jgi:hypothetical protein
MVSWSTVQEKLEERVSCIINKIILVWNIIGKEDLDHRTVLE